MTAISAPVVEQSERYTEVLSILSSCRKLRTADTTDVKRGRSDAPSKGSGVGPSCATIRSAVHEELLARQSDPCAYEFLR